MRPLGRVFAQPLLNPRRVSPLPETAASRYWSCCSAHLDGSRQAHPPLPRTREQALKEEADGLGKALDAASVLTPRSEAAYSRINQEFDNLISKQSGAPSHDQVRAHGERRVFTESRDTVPTHSRTGNPEPWCGQAPPSPPPQSDVATHSSCCGPTPHHLLHPPYAHSTE
jgi:hypothetical protein